MVSSKFASSLLCSMLMVPFVTGFSDEEAFSTSGSDVGSTFVCSGLANFVALAEINAPVSFAPSSLRVWPDSSTVSQQPKP